MSDTISINYKDFVKEYNREYSTMYDAGRSGSYVSDLFDVLLENSADFKTACAWFNENSGDFMTSDRECAAFLIAYCKTLSNLW